MRSAGAVEPIAGMVGHRKDALTCSLNAICDGVTRTWALQVSSERWEIVVRFPDKVVPPAESDESCMPQ